MKSELQKAVEILCDELSKDKSEGSYYYSWQANIAMAFKDEIARMKIQRNYLTSEDVHQASNQAAKNFLDLLISKK